MKFIIFLKGKISQYKPIWFSTNWFLDISKAFDNVWHEGLLYKLKCFGSSENLLKLIKHYLADRSQRVLLNGQCSNWQTAVAGNPQGAILGPLFFKYILMTCLVEWNLMLNYLQAILLFSQLLYR